jgi:hypothetical protein
MFSRFEKLALGTKLSIAFLLIIIVIASISGITLARVKTLIDSTEQMYSKDLIGISLLRQVNSDVNVIGRVLNRAALARAYNDTETAQRALTAIEATEKGLLVNLDKAKDTIIRTELRTKLNQANETQAEYIKQ